VTGYMLYIVGNKKRDFKGKFVLRLLLRHKIEGFVFVQNGLF
jgi:hypothetical protein